MAPKKIIFLNGPPRSGKDAAGKILDHILGGECVKLAHSLKVGTHALFAAMQGVKSDMTSIEDFGILSRADDWYEGDKDEPLPAFYDLTPREAYIAVSEKLFKPMFGDTFFGQVLAENILKADGVNFFITDSGFSKEAQPIIKTFGAENCKLVRLYREGKDFAGDSRNYVCLPIETYDVTNDGTLADLEDALRAIVE